MHDRRFHIQVISRRLRPVHRSVPLLRAVLDAGADSVRLRDEAAGISATIQELKLTGSWDRSRVVVNDAAAAAGSFGVPWLHLPSRWLDMTPPFGKFARISMSVHSVSEAIEAESLGVDCVTFGHVFSTSSHPDEPGRGLDELAEVVARVRIPVLAIGGVAYDNILQTLQTGCAGVAFISAVLDADDPDEATRRLRDIVDGSAAVPRVPLLPLPAPARKGTSR